MLLLPKMRTATKATPLRVVVVIVVVVFGGKMMMEVGSGREWL
jgi:Sec-independent protein translocase protein TatA